MDKVDVLKSLIFSACVTKLLPQRMLSPVAGEPHLRFNAYTRSGILQELHQPVIPLAGIGRVFQEDMQGSVESLQYWLAGTAEGGSGFMHRISTSCSTAVRDGRRYCGQPPVRQPGKKKGFIGKAEQLGNRLPQLEGRPSLYK
ncbi:MAG: hypothetical protein LUE13_09220 [Akkermansiaceae bacterium]|nr:hypothetical protein [Akkermansiaceae bacterium]